MDSEQCNYEVPLHYVNGNDIKQNIFKIIQIQISSNIKIKSNQTRPEGLATPKNAF